MALKLHTFTHGFTIPGSYRAEVDFFNTINVADVALKGIETKFSKGDNHIQSLKFRATNASIDSSKTKINFNIEYDHRDSSGNEGEATLDFLIIADVDVKLQKDPQVKIYKI